MEPQDPTKVRLIEAAGEEFAGKGFDSARVRKICDRAGANVAAINYHFGDKEQLYVETVLHAHRCGCESPDAEVPLPPAPPISFAVSSTTSCVMSWRSTTPKTGGIG